jgi:hypothetical protein
VIDLLTADHVMEITQNAWLIDPAAKSADMEEISENRLVAKYQIGPTSVGSCFLRYIAGATAPIKSTIINGFGTSEAPGHSGANLSGPFDAKSVVDDPYLYLPLFHEHPGKYSPPKKIERWIEPLPDVHGQPELQAQNKALYQEWNEKLNEIAKNFKPTDRYTFDPHFGGNCARCGSELFFVAGKPMMKIITPVSKWRKEQCADCGRWSSRRIGARPFADLRQRMSDTADAFDSYDAHYQDAAAREVATGLTLADLTMPEYGEVGFQEIKWTDGVKRKARKPWPEWLGYSRTNNGRVLGYNESTMEVVYHKFPLLRRVYTTLTPEEKKAHRTQMKEAAQTMAAVCRWFFWPSTDEQLAEETGLDESEVKALRRSFIETGNFLHSPQSEMAYQASVRFTKRVQLSKKDFDEWEIRLEKNGRKPPLISCPWLPEPFNCQRPDRILKARWRTFFTS